MAKADLAFPIEGLHGKIDRNSTLYHTTRWGQNVVSNYPKHRKPSTISDKQRSLNLHFQQAVDATQADLNDPIKRAYWQEQFDQQIPLRKYKILRNFVIAQYIKRG